IRVDPGRDRQGPYLRDAAARPQRPRLHAARLLARDAPKRGGARAAQGTRRRPRLGTDWAQNGQIDVRGARAPLRLRYRKPALARAFLTSGRPDLNRGPHRPERCALPGCATPRLDQPSIGRGRGPSARWVRVAVATMSRVASRQAWGSSLRASRIWSERFSGASTRSRGSSAAWPAT